MVDAFGSRDDPEPDFPATGITGAGICAWGPCTQDYGGDIPLSIGYGYHEQMTLLGLCRLHLALLENWRQRYQENPHTYFTLKGLRNETP